MSKSHKIRWRESDHERLRREINKFNDRLYYQKKKNPDATYLPERASYSQTVSTIQTRADFNRVIKSLGAFNAQSAKKVQKKGKKATTKWAEKQLKNERARKEREYKRKEEERNKQRLQLAKEIGEKPVRLGGVDQGVKRAEMGRITENAVKPTTADTSKMSMSELNKRLEMIDRQLDPATTRKKRELWQRNYIKAMVREGYPADVIELLKEIDPDEFAQIVDVDEYAKLKFVYDPLEIDSRVKIIRDTWTHYASKRRGEWLNRYLSLNPGVREKLDEKSIGEFVNGTRDHMITNDAVIELMMAYEKDRVAFDVNVMEIRAEVLHEATQGYFGRAFEDQMKNGK